MKKLFLILLCLFIAGCTAADPPEDKPMIDETIVIDDDPPEPEKPKTILETAKISPIIWNGRDVGNYSVAYADSAICTEEALCDWYFNYVEANELWYGIIIYTDQGDSDYGILGSEGYVSVGVPIGYDEFGNVSCLDTTDAIKYIASGGVLVRVS